MSALARQRAMNKCAHARKMAASWKAKPAPWHPTARGYDRWEAMRKGRVAKFNQDAAHWCKIADSLVDARATVVTARAEAKATTVTAKADKKAARISGGGASAGEVVIGQGLDFANDLVTAFGQGQDQGLVRPAADDEGIPTPVKVVGAVLLAAGLGYAGYVGYTRWRR